jgi:hypothetical protein
MNLLAIYKKICFESKTKKNKVYRRLKKGEIIREGDEIDTCNDAWRDDPVWEKVTTCIGEPAPDPQYVAHRQYRRLEVIQGGIDDGI